MQTDLRATFFFNPSSIFLNGVARAHFKTLAPTPTPVLGTRKQTFVHGAFANGAMELKGTVTLTNPCFPMLT